MPTEREKMVRGELYLASDPELVAARVRARRLFARFNASDPGDAPGRLAILRELMENVGVDAWIEPPFHCDYGTQIRLGAGERRRPRPAGASDRGGQSGARGAGAVVRQAGRA